MSPRNSVPQAALVGSGAETTQAVDNMLEVVPQGMHKWVGMEVLLAELGLDASQVRVTCRNRCEMPRQVPKAAPAYISMMLAIRCMPTCMAASRPTHSRDALLVVPRM